MENGIPQLTRQGSLTIELSISTTRDGISQLPRKASNQKKTSLRCNFLPFLLITFCAVSTVMTIFDNVTVVNYLKRSTLARPIYKKEMSITELPIQIQHAIQTESQKRHRPFPRWGKSMEEEETNGIDFHRIMDFVMNASSWARVLPDRRYVQTSDHWADVGSWFPEVLYVLDHEGVHVSDLHRNIVATKGRSSVKDKFVPVEKKMLDAYHLLWKDTAYSFEKWPHLSKVVLKNATDADLPSSGFPFLMWYGDYTGCNHLNWKGEYSIPLYTVAALDSCNYTFPFVNYGNAIDSNVNWKEQLEIANKKFSWSDKLQQVVWRGGLTGAMADMDHKSPRWIMMETVNALKSEYDSEIASSDSPSNQPFLFDFGATRLPGKHKKFTPFVEEVGGFVESMVMEDFQRYRGILDMDGNSWSMRFGRLLCYNSVVLKVEPTWVEYFYYKEGWLEGEPKLQPWVHYIPVKADLSDLAELSEFVVDPANDEFLLTMVESANAWCQGNMVRRRIAIDMLNIWERYLELITANNPNWIQDDWKPAKEAIFGPSSVFDMNDASIGSEGEEKEK